MGGTVLAILVCMQYVNMSMLQTEVGGGAREG